MIQKKIGRFTVKLGKWLEDDIYNVYITFNGETIPLLECLSQDEVDNLAEADIIECLTIMND